jgi:hypothetical protein
VWQSQARTGAWFDRITIVFARVPGVGVAIPIRGYRRNRCQIFEQFSDLQYNLYPERLTQLGMMDTAAGHGQLTEIKR